MSKIISIIGHRDSPPEILETIEKIAGFFAQKGWILRTGGAIGADEAGRQGFIKAGKESNIQLYLPWQGYNNLRGTLFSPANWAEAAEHHPVWDKLSTNIKCLHARNMSIMLSEDNKTPSDLVVAYTDGGKEVGGSATGLSCARKYKIKTFNLGEEKALDKLRKFCKKL